MALAAVPILVVIGGLLALSLFHSRVNLSGFFQDLLNAPFLIGRLTGSIIEWASQGVTAHFSPVVEAATPALASLFNGVAGLTASVGQTTWDLADSTYTALHGFRRVTLPTLITANVQPINARIAGISTRVGATEAAVSTLAPLRRSVATLDAQVGTLAGEFAGLRPLPARVGALEGTAGTLTGELNGLRNGTLPAGLAAAIGALIASRAFTNSLASEAGLDTSACRSKVKGICSTPPARWANLLGGLALVSGTLSLSEILPVARTLMHATHGLIEAAR